MRCGYDKIQTLGGLSVAIPSDQDRRIKWCEILSRALVITTLDRWMNAWLEGEKTAILEN